MKCIECGHSESRVLDTRVSKEGEIRRRRECMSCGHRYTTIESVLRQYPHVLKRDGSREPFNKEKLKKGIQLACLKRQVSLADIESLVKRVAQAVLDSNDKEFSSVQIGEIVMSALKEVDNVAYVRFASVYRTFKDVHEFVSILDDSKKGLEQKFEGKTNEH